uniref:ATP-dependent RNA helicase n=1 Tax=Lotharella vacuolata TaxID=74820 RepID=A0A0H5BL59_9EUKA|nr:ATP-dependent RNA helicase [Lotharella vacuolata]
MYLIIVFKNIIYKFLSCYYSRINCKTIKLNINKIKQNKYSKNIIVNILFKKIMFDIEHKSENSNYDYVKKTKKNKNIILGIQNNFINTFPIFKKIIMVKELNCEKKTKNHLKHIFMIKKWETLKLDVNYIDVLRKKTILIPLPLQSIIIPIFFKGQDFICLAKTGSGKTLCYLVPSLKILEIKTKMIFFKKLYELFIVPTRELSLQVYKDFSAFLKYLDITIMCLYGGVFAKVSQIKNFDKFMLVVGTPGKLKNYFFDTKKNDCSNTRHLIIDEADKIFELGFEWQIRKMLLNMRLDKHTSVFCSFLPYNIEINIRRYQINPLKIKIGGFKELNDKICQFFEFVTIDKKLNRLLEILSYWFDFGKIIIFTNTLSMACKVHFFLSNKGYDPLILHSKLESIKRLKALYIFKNSLQKILIATSLASRGLNFFNLNLVINFEVPTSFRDYINRVGRTGRMGNKGTAITFVNKNEKKINQILKKINDLNNSLENVSIIYENI